MSIYNLLKSEITPKELLDYYEVYISNETLDTKIFGLIYHYKGINNIIINKNLSNYKKKKAILHELAHVELSQLNQVDNDLFALKISNYEDEAVKYINFILESMQ